MKRFLDHFVVQPESWPIDTDFSAEISSLIRQSHVEHNFGSLSQSAVEDELRFSCGIQFLPPVTEKGFKPDELDELRWIKTNKDEKLLILYQQSKAIKTPNGKLLGSASSRYSRSSVVFVSDFTKPIQLAEIQFFAESSRQYRLHPVFFFTCVQSMVWKSRTGVVKAI